MTNLIHLWNKLEKLPFGKWLFSKMLGIFIPYTGTMKAVIQSIEKTPSGGTATVRLRDRKRVRNHLDSIHAVALMNLSELTTGVAVIAAMPPKSRMILKHFEIDYIAKARGTLLSHSHCPTILDSSDCEIKVPVEIKDTSGVVVCRAVSTWKIGAVRS